MIYTVDIENEGTLSINLKSVRKILRRSPEGSDSQRRVSLYSNGISASAVTIPLEESEYEELMNLWKISVGREYNAD